MIFRTRHPLRISIATLGMAVLLAACGSAADPESPVTATPDLVSQVQTTGGAVRGVVEEGISVFRGIPYAGDVSGAGRWHPPGAAPHWQGIRDASSHGPICPQSTLPRNGVVAPWLAQLDIDEDCLNLSVYSPAPNAEAKAPVMVWIHGGFARIGSGAQHDGKALAQRGAVVVTINYRLDRLGLFAHPALSTSQPDEPLANYGLMDMAAALRWVQANIAVFGGDADNVTIFGQSSGGVAVTALMTSPLTQGLYHRAIAQSGAMANLEQEQHLAQALPGSPSLESDGEAMAAALGVSADGDVPAQLRALPWQEIIGYTEAQAASALVPVIDGRVLPANVDRTFAAGKQHPTPLMIGSTDWEESLVANFNLPLVAILRGVPANKARAAYPGLDDKTLVGAWFADTAFHVPAHFLAGQVASHGQPAWLYRFTHLDSERSDGQLGAAHSDDVPYLLAQRGQTAQTGEALTPTMTGYWFNFARSGDPNGPGLPPWRGAATGEHELMMLAVPAAMQPDPFAERINHHLQRYDRKLGTPQP